MIRESIHVLALFIGIVGCLFCLPGDFRFQHRGPIPFAGGVVQPFASSPDYDVTEPPGRRQMTVDERLSGPGNAPPGGAGLMWTFDF